MFQGTNGGGNRDGFVGGAQVGFNYQFTPGSGFVVGVEADIQWLGGDNDSKNTGFFGSNLFNHAPVAPFLTPGAGLLAASPGYVLIGMGYGMAVPTISSIAVSALPPERSGLAAGVLNSARQVGTALGLATLGAVGLAVTRNSWAAQSAQLPTSAQAGAPDIVQDVSGGQGSVVAQQLGAAAKPLVDRAFVDGLHVALLIGGGLMLVAAVFAFIVLRRPAVAVPNADTGALGLGATDADLSERG